MATVAAVPPNVVVANEKPNKQDGDAEDTFTSLAECKYSNKFLLQLFNKDLVPPTKVGGYTGVISREAQVPVCLTPDWNRNGTGFRYQRGRYGNRGGRRGRGRGAPSKWDSRWGPSERDGPNSSGNSRWGDRGDGNKRPHSARTERPSPWDDPRTSKWNEDEMRKTDFENARKAARKADSKPTAADGATSWRSKPDGKNAQNSPKNDARNKTRQNQNNTGLPQMPTKQSPGPKRAPEGQPKPEPQPQMPSPVLNASPSVPPGMPMPESPQQANRHFDEQLEAENATWYYRDPQGQVRGPFPARDMNVWLQYYFPVTILVSRNKDKGFAPLIQIVQATGKNPFTGKPWPMQRPPGMPPGMSQGMPMGKGAGGNPMMANASPQAQHRGVPMNRPQQGGMDPISALSSQFGMMGAGGPAPTNNAQAAQPYNWNKAWSKENVTQGTLPPAASPKQPQAAGFMQDPESPGEDLKRKQGVYRLDMIEPTGGASDQNKAVKATGENPDILKTLFASHDSEKQPVKGEAAQKENKEPKVESDDDLAGDTVLMKPQASAAKTEAKKKPEPKKPANKGPSVQEKKRGQKNQKNQKKQGARGKAKGKKQPSPRVNKHYTQPMPSPGAVKNAPVKKEAVKSPPPKKAAPPVVEDTVNVPIQAAPAPWAGANTSKNTSLSDIQKEQTIYLQKKAVSREQQWHAESLIKHKEAQKRAQPWGKNNAKAKPSIASILSQEEEKRRKAAAKKKPNGPPPKSAFPWALHASPPPSRGLLQIQKEQNSGLNQNTWKPEKEQNVIHIEAGQDTNIVAQLQATLQTHSPSRGPQSRGPQPRPVRPSKQQIYNPNMPNAWSKKGNAASTKGRSLRDIQAEEMRNKVPKTRSTLPHDPAILTAHKRIPKLNNSKGKKAPSLYEIQQQQQQARSRQAQMGRGGQRGGQPKHSSGWTMNAKPRAPSLKEIQNQQRSSSGRSQNVAVSHDIDDEEDFWAMDTEEKPVAAAPQPNEEFPSLGAANNRQTNLQNYNTKPKPGVNKGQQKSRSRRRGGRNVDNSMLGFTNDYSQRSFVTPGDE